MDQLQTVVRGAGFFNFREYRKLESTERVQPLQWEFLKIMDFSVSTISIFNDFGYRFHSTPKVVNGSL